MKRVCSFPFCLTWYGFTQTLLDCVMMRPGSYVSNVFLCTGPVDFRKSIAGLSLLVVQSLRLDPFAASPFVFVNRRLDKIKILCWEKNGFCL